MVAKKTLLIELTQVEQVPKNVNAVLALINLKANGDSEQANNMKVLILKKALPKIFNKINVLLRL